jgi:toxin YhaV
MTQHDGKQVINAVVNGWSLFAHPLFLDQVEELIARVDALEAKDPKNYRQKNSTKRLAAITKLAFEVIPQDPERPEYRQGSTLGDGRKHWFRAKFYQQYRLCFRFHAAQRIIVYAWVNDEDSKRAYESNADAYRTFRKMLEGGNPPDDWDVLLGQARAASKRLAPIAKPRK